MARRLLRSFAMKQILIVLAVQLFATFHHSTALACSKEAPPPPLFIAGPRISISTVEASVSTDGVFVIQLSEALRSEDIQVTLVRRPDDTPIAGVLANHARGKWWASNAPLEPDTLYKLRVSVGAFSTSPANPLHQLEVDVRTTAGTAPPLPPPAFASFQVTEARVGECKPDSPRDTCGDCLEREPTGGKYTRHFRANISTTEHPLAALYEYRVRVAPAAALSTAVYTAWRPFLANNPSYNFLDSSAAQDPGSEYCMELVALDPRDGSEHTVKNCANSIADRAALEDVPGVATLKPDATKPDTMRGCSAHSANGAWPMALLALVALYRRSAMKQTASIVLSALAFLSLRTAAEACSRPPPPAPLLVVAPRLTPSQARTETTTDGVFVFELADLQRFDQVTVSLTAEVDQTPVAGTLRRHARGALWTSDAPLAPQADYRLRASLGAFVDTPKQPDEQYEILLTTTAGLAEPWVTPSVKRFDVTEGKEATYGACLPNSPISSCGGCTERERTGSVYTRTFTGIVNLPEHPLTALYEFELRHYPASSPGRTLVTPWTTSRVTGDLAFTNKFTNSEAGAGTEYCVDLVARDPRSGEEKKVSACDVSVEFTPDDDMATGTSKAKGCVATGQTTGQAMSQLAVFVAAAIAARLARRSRH